MDFYLSNYNYLGNLQLLEATPNEEKKATPFIEWLSVTYKNEDQRKDYMKKNYIPDVDLSLANFEEFMDEREKLIVEALKKQLT